MAIQLQINGKPYDLDVDDDMPLLWAIRDIVGLTGTKFGCGKALCGACTVMLNNQAIRSCLTPVSVAKGGSITTIEAIDALPQGKALQQAWVELDVPAPASGSGSHPIHHSAYQ